MTLKKYLLTSSVFFLSLVNVHTYAAPVANAMTQEKQAKMTPEKALAQLKSGNQRFQKGNIKQYDFAKKMKKTSTYGQFPMAVILSCIDSRSIPDVMFDQGLGNIFVSRVAGNVADKNIIGSMEFATKVAGAPLIVVMGHTHCGAVQGACFKKDTGLNNLNALLAQIKPAVRAFSKKQTEMNCNNMTQVDDIAKLNVIEQMQFITDNSSAIKQMAQDKKIMIVGAMHDIQTGKVSFFDMQGEAL